MKKTTGRKLRRRTRIVNKPRFVLFCMMCIMVATICAGTLTSVYATRQADSYQLCVSAGDTLWEIARSSNTKNKDLRRVIDDIMRLNKMRSADIQTGDVLWIPIY